KGQTTFDAVLTTRDRVTDLTVLGTVGVTGGAAPVPALLGNAAKVALAVTVRGDEITLERAQVDGRALRASAKGAGSRDRFDADWKLSLSDLSALGSIASGRLEAQGRAQGTRDNIELTADATGEIATHGYPGGPIRASVRLRGLPGSPSGKIDASGTLDGSPLQVALAIERSRDGALRSTIDRADWKSVHAEGALTLRAGDKLPQGRLAARIAQLADLQPWIGQPVQGALTASVELAQAGAQARIELDARNVGIPGTLAEHVTVTGRVDDPANQAVAALQVAAQGVASNGVTGSVRLEANGPRNALRLNVSSELHHPTEGDVPLGATATVDAVGGQVTIATLQARYRGQPVQLLAPVRISFRDGVAVDRLRVGMQQAVLEVAGRVSPTLDLAASVRNATPALARTFLPDLQADGTLTMDARLTGTLSEPRGSVKLSASGLRMRTGTARSLPPANVTANARLEAQSAQIDAKISAGNRVQLDATGRVPLSATGPIDVRARGTVDASVANPMLEVSGRRVKGRITVDLGISGTLASPRAEGTLRLSEGEVQDYALGAQLTKVDAVLEAAGDTVRISSLTAHAGPGTISASGSVGVFAPGRAVDVKITARNAKPLSTDLLTANMDADITLRGEYPARLVAAGSIAIHRAEITIPKALPPTVAVLDVRRPGQKPPPPSAPGLALGLDLKVDAPRAVFVHGRSLDAETGGELRVRGTSAAPQVSGGFDMRRGSFDLGGASLKFTSGKVSFAGTGLSQKIDPTLDFLAETTSGEITARLSVTGYADAPRIALSSTPEMPQDEILARLLFGVSAKQLSPLQLAQIAAAVATIAGVGGDNNPLTAIQKSLGLDRLSTGTTPTGGTVVEAGRYVSERVYVGAKQSTQGGTQAQVQVDLTKNLKLQATLGTGGTVPVQGATPENDPGSSLGLSYQFEY
ncbi:MAG TPA: translocation/assembly module TamB domain-containing protein, partial [Casimicrobiaceae bacterium]|nr:translocation/assembly module TamB domain-containing protein [Casimicrobiaceae bacterium]